MTARERNAGIAVVVVVALGAYWCGQNRIPSQMTVAEARKRSLVTIGASAGAERNVIDLHVTFSSGAATTIIVPAGTKYGATGGYQDVMAAETVQVVFAGSGGSAQTQNIRQPVYCLDRFRPLPTSGSPFTAAIDDEPTDDLGRLAVCLEKRRGAVPFDTLQMAVWLIKHDLLGKTRSQARAVFRQGLRGEGLKKLEAELNRVSADLRAQGFSDEDVANGIREYRETHLESALDAVIDSELGKNWQSARPVLAGCGVPVDNAPFFRS